MLIRLSLFSLDEICLANCVNRSYEYLLLCCGSFHIICHSNIEGIVASTALIKNIDDYFSLTIGLNINQSCLQ